MISAPLKFKTIRGNQVSFMTKNFNKETMNKSRLRNKYLKWPHRMIRGCSSDIASSDFFRLSKVWRMLHHGQWGRVQNKIKETKL